MEPLAEPVSSMHSSPEASSSVTSGTNSSDSSNAESIEATTSKRKRIEKYNLRRSSLIKRVEVEEKIKQPKEPKAKVKPPPLSKYRRKSANARERNRMSEMNIGYQRLQEALPSMGDDVKITKLTLLRLAMNYIKSLQDVLGYADGATSSTSLDSSGGSNYSSSSGDEASFSPVSDFLLSDGCTDDLMSLNLDELLS